ncbi:uncharacterized protein LOC130677518 [Microplitis mediator]|uniref:uncharacterized protein LOC130677518 n=1 Tax=Microplitis mediator TaxID=375433 RepID=UPI002554D7FE|nr:uncharacterized protein LOC130677518 [Microplitis mediator]
MKPVILIICAVLSAFVFCENKIFKTQTTQYSSSINDHLKKLLGTCFLNHTNPIISDEQFSDIIYEALEGSQLSPSVMLINEDFQSKPPKPLFLPAYPSYILSGNSPPKLKSILTQLKSSQWWSIESIFISVDLGTNSCKNAQTSLQVLWEMNLLSSFYVCIKNDLMIYMFNPFTNRAPELWTEVEIKNKESDDPWTLYSQPYSEDQEFQKSLFFDKTKKLAGYKINAVANTVRNRTWKPNKIYNLTTMQDKLASIQNHLFTSMCSYMNVTPLIYFDLPGAPVSSKEIGFVKGLINGSYDIAFSPRPVGDDYNVSYMFLMRDVGLVILTQHRKFLTPFEKINRYYSTGVILLSSLVLAMTSLLITIYYKRNFVEASTEVLRMALSASIEIPLITFPIRIYFFGILLLILIINATFQGHIALFLTKPERITVDSLTSLHELGYKLYIPRIALKSSIFMKRKINVEPSIDCTQRVLDDPNVACIGDTNRLLAIADNNDSLHISPIIDRFMPVILIRDDWPLRNKGNDILRKHAEFGLHDFWDHKLSIDPLKKLHSKESLLTEARYRPIKFEDVDFAFIIFGICLVPATIVFTFEIYYGYYVYCD